MDNNVALKHVLLQEFSTSYRNGIYGYTQRSLAYNSNHIEGSILTPEQTTALFEERFLPSCSSEYRAKDVEEMTGHFLMFNKMLLTLKQPLSEELIKSFHYELKAGVFEDRANGYAIGDYKKRPNTVGGIVTSAPKAVHEDMQKLLQWYQSIESVGLQDLAEFHSRYESIHPFQDGNGRTGRLLLFRECLYHGITPLIIRDSSRARYMHALKAAHGGDYTPMTELFAEEQADYIEKIEYFDVDGAYEDSLAARTPQILQI